MSNYAVINDFDPRTNEKINGTDVEPEAELDFWLRVRLFFLEYFVETFLTVVLALCALPHRRPRALRLRLLLSRVRDERDDST